jgi:hypothetical protein
MKSPARQDGQALMEFALTVPLFALIVMVVIQFGLIFIAYYSETRMTRETARWLAVHSMTTSDGAVGTHVQATMLPGLTGGTSNVIVGSTAASPTGDAVATVGRMSVRYTPCVPDINSNCSHANRQTSATLFVQMQYDVGDIIFLPTDFGFGSLRVTIPTTLPAYKLWVMVE